jgi:hypothetical protein
MGVHHQIFEDQVVLVKDFKPTFDEIELILVPDIDDLAEAMMEAKGIMGDMAFSQVKELYGECRLLSAMDYPDTGTTSLMIVDSRHSA